VTEAPPTTKFGAKINFFSAFWAPLGKGVPPGYFRAILINLKKWILGKWIFNLAEAEF